MFGFNPNEYDIKLELSMCCNGIGSVYLAEHKPSGEFISLKRFKIDKVKEENNNFIKEEILTIRQFNHPNILTFHTAFVYNYEVYLIAPIMCYCSCRDVIINYFTTGFPETIVSLILKDCLNGLEYLHKRGFIHRSIRASHILLNKTKAVLCGFRECTSLLSHGERAKTLHELPPNGVKGLNWLAPEVLEQNLLGYTEKSDIYSIGITTCELTNGLEPFSDMPTTFMLTEKIRGNQPALLDCSTCPEEIIAQATDSGVGDSLAAIQTRQIYSQRQLSDPFHKFAEICMSRYPNDRPTVSQLLNHVFFKQCKNTTLYEYLFNSGIDAIDCTKLKDDTIGLMDNISDLKIDNSTFEWDFN